MATMTSGSLFTVTQGNVKIGLKKGQKGRVVSTEAMGPLYSGMVRVVLSVNAKTKVLWARSKNRLSDSEVPLGCGDGINRVLLQVAIFQS